MWDYLEMSLRIETMDKYLLSWIPSNKDVY